MKAELDGDAKQRDLEVLKIQIKHYEEKIEDFETQKTELEAKMVDELLPEIRKVEMLFCWRRKFHQGRKRNTCVGRTTRGTRATYTGARLPNVTSRTSAIFQSHRCALSVLGVRAPLHFVLVFKALDL